MTRLSVNVNKIALLRNARDIGVPSVADAARTALDAGAAGITVHPRPDQRHIRPGDCTTLSGMLAERNVEFNIEGNPFAGPTGTYPGFLAIIEACQPAQATLVPDSADQTTSDHGWDLARDGERLVPLIEQRKGWGCRVSLFMDADPERIQDAARVGADRVELYTEPYARAAERDEADAVLPAYVAGAELAADVGLGVNAGHDLNLDNLAAFVREVPGVLEVSIGHALVADALTMGLAAAVRRYLGCLTA
jgi:pyridoxine 5-phosphate synthase